MIRDSDGTQLSDEILNAGYDIYSTICIIRDHNAWAKEHPECLQQSFLSTEPVIAAEEPLTVKPMAGFFDEQFKINDRPEALRYWQVWDRTANKLLPADTWQWDAAAGTVTVASPVPFHAYTVSFWHGAPGKRSTCTTMLPTAGPVSTCCLLIRAPRKLRTFCTTG